MDAWRDANGNIPPNGLAEALQAKKEFLEHDLDEDGFGQVPVSGLSWVSRGPENVGGRTRAVIVQPHDPEDPPVVWAGSAGGGVWKSDDGGETWLPMNDPMQNYIVSSLAQDPNDTTYKTLYAGTGEHAFNEGGMPGGGMYKTTDGGMSWFLLTSTNPRRQNNAHWDRVNRISVKPGVPSGTPAVLLAANLSGIWRSENGGTSWGANPVAPGSGSRFVSFDPNNGSNAVAEVVNSQGVPTVMYSTNGGVGWQTATIEGKDGPEPFVVPDGIRIELAYGAENVVYAIHREQSNVPSHARVSRSADGGHHFEPMNTALTWYSDGIDPGDYAVTLWASPTEPNLVLAGGLFLYRSEDGGDSFTQISIGWGFPVISPHRDQHCAVSDPFVPNRVFVCSDGGIHKTEDIETAEPESGWEYASIGYRTSQYYRVAGDAQSGIIYGGTQDQGTVRSLLATPTPAAESYGGDGGASAIGANSANCYGEYVGLKIHRSNCTGQYGTSIFCGSGNHPDFCSTIGDGYLYDAVVGDARFVAPFVLDPNDTSRDRIIAGGRSVWRTNNAETVPQPIWKCIRGPGGGPCVTPTPTPWPSPTPTPWPTPTGTPMPTPTPTPSARVSAISIAPGNSNIIWVAYEKIQHWNPNEYLGVFKTSNGLSENPTWTPISNNPFNKHITRILIDDDDEDIVYVAQGGFGDDNLYKTTDGGATWTDITGPPQCPLQAYGGLPCAPIRGIARHPNDPNRLYVGTEIGLYSTNDGGANWSTEREGPSTVSIDEVSFMRGSTTLLAATHGRGLWTAETEPPPAPNFIPFDFDADGRSDVGVFRPSDGIWRVRRSSQNFLEVQFGAPGDVVAVEDYDGDQKADVAVFRAADGAWYRLNSSDGSFHATYFGTEGDIVVPADYDGDGLGDEAVFRPSD